MGAVQCLKLVLILNCCHFHQNLAISYEFHIGEKFSMALYEMLLCMLELKELATCERTYAWKFGNLPIQSRLGAFADSITKNR
jgi:hypothetical protein